MILFITACENGPVEYKPESGSVSGKVTFQKIDNWPSSSSIAIALSLYWPPQGAPAAFTSISYDSLIINQNVGSYNYIFENITLNRAYGSIAVSWKDPNDNNSETNQHVLGAYGGSLAAEFWDADSIMLTDDIYEIENLDFIVDLDLVNETQLAEVGSIQGTITFNGSWPDDQVYISLNSLCCPLVSTPAEFYIITSDQLVNNQIDYIFENIILEEYYIAVFKQTNWETLGAYPSLENPESISLSAANSNYVAINFSVTFID